MTVVVKGEPLSEQEQQAYVNYLQEKFGRRVDYLEIEAAGEEVNLSYRMSEVPFERIRRITGYLVGTMSDSRQCRQDLVCSRPRPDSCSASSSVAQ